MVLLDHFLFVPIVLYRTRLFGLSLSLLHTSYNFSPFNIIYISNFAVNHYPWRLPYSLSLSTTLRIRRPSHQTVPSVFNQESGLIGVSSHLTDDLPVDDVDKLQDWVPDFNARDSSLALRVWPVNEIPGGSGCFSHFDVYSSQ